MTTVRGEFELGLYSISETRYFFERLIAKKVCTAFSRTSYKIVPLTNLNKYLYNDKFTLYVHCLSCCNVILIHGNVDLYSYCSYLYYMTMNKRLRWSSG